ncbi:MAG: hypothetical protein PHX78_12535 [bacterium]|nr:hypothetical protein [bacterium]
MKNQVGLSKIIFLIILCLLFNFSSGCGKPLVKSEKNELQNRRGNKKWLLERHQAVTAELKIIKDKLDEVTGQIYVFTTKEKYGSKMINDPMEKDDESKMKLDFAKIESKDLQNKYDALASELKEIEQNLKDLGAPIEK